MRRLDIHNLPFIVLVFITNFSFSQSFDKTDEGLKFFIRNLYEVKVNGLKETKDSKVILEVFDQVFNGNEVSIDLDGKVFIKKLSKSFMIARVDDYLMYEDLKVNYSIHEIYSTKVSGNSGFIEFVLSYTLKEKDRVVSEGITFMNVVAKHNGSTWKITYLSDFGNDLMKNKGDCFCEIYNKGKDKYFATIFYPNGDQYAEDLYAIKISVPFDRSVIPIPLPTDLILSESEPLKKFIFNREDEYLWYNQLGTIYKDEEKVGVAKNPNRVIRTILMHKYNEHCRSLKLKKMR